MGILSWLAAIRRSKGKLMSRVQGYKYFYWPPFRVRSCTFCQKYWIYRDWDMTVPSIRHWSTLDNNRFGAWIIDAHCFQETKRTFSQSTWCEELADSILVQSQARPTTEDSFLWRWFTAPTAPQTAPYSCPPPSSQHNTHFPTSSRYPTAHAQHIR